MRKPLLIALLLFVGLNPAWSQSKGKKNNKNKADTQEAAQPNKKEARVEITTNFGNITVALYNETPLHRDNFIKLCKEGFYDSLLFHRVIKGFMIQGGDPTSKNADSTQMLGSGDNGYRIAPEFNKFRIHKRGALAAARDNNPEKKSSGCQFYIVQGKTFTIQELETVMNNKNLNKKQEIFYKFYQTDSISQKFAELQNKGDKEGVKAYFDTVMVEVDKVYQKSEPFIYNTEQVKAYTTIGGAPHLDGDYTVFGEVISGMDVVDKIASVATGAADRPVQNVRILSAKIIR